MDVYILGHEFSVGVLVTSIIVQAFFVVTALVFKRKYAKDNHEVKATVD